VRPFTREPLLALDGRAAEAAAVEKFKPNDE
jgi:hypothetical protein